MTSAAIPLDGTRALRATLGEFATGVAIVTARRQTGDHVLFVIEVVGHRRTHGEPLVFHASRYGKIERAAEAIPAMG